MPDSNCRIALAVYTTYGFSCHSTACQAIHQLLALINLIDWSPTVSMLTIHSAHGPHELPGKHCNPAVTWRSVGCCRRRCGCRRWGCRRRRCTADACHQGSEQKGSAPEQRPLAHAAAVRHADGSEVRSISRICKANQALQCISVLSSSGARRNVAAGLPAAVSPSAQASHWQADGSRLQPIAVLEAAGAECAVPVITTHSGHQDLDSKLRVSRCSV
jgi:hypothetical protein